MEERAHEALEQSARRKDGMTVENTVCLDEHHVAVCRGGRGQKEECVQHTVIIGTFVRKMPCGCKSSQS